MFLSNISNVKGKELGLVSGSMVKGKFFIKDWLAGVRKFLGKELKEYTELMEETRATALARMITQGEKLGADAIVNIRFMTTEITSDASEIFVYGTAIKKEEFK